MANHKRRSINKGSILTYTGMIVSPLDPDPDTLVLEDIAHALANICRYTGHSSRYYSVAEHSVRVAQAILDNSNEPAKAFDGLMHDSSEAYLGDVSRPVKHGTYVGKLYGSAEERLMKALAEKFDFTWPKPRWVTLMDRKLLYTEQRDLMPYPNDYYTLDGCAMLDETINPWTPEEAEIEFLDTYAELSESAVGVETL